MVGMSAPENLKSSERYNKILENHWAERADVDERFRNVLKRGVNASPEEFDQFVDKLEKAMDHREKVTNKALRKVSNLTKKEILRKIGKNTAIGTAIGAGVGMGINHLRKRKKD